MTELADTDNALEPLAYSADGKRNSFTLACTPTGQSMNYAACIWRQNVLANPKTITPPDWNVCKQAREEGRCTALIMRKEEELAGKSIYFRCRKTIMAASAAAREWIMPKGEPYPARPAAAHRAAAAPKSMLDAMGSMGDLSDAVSAVARSPDAVATAPVKTPDAPRPRIVTALAGESPLQMARRLHAERQPKP